MKKIILVVIIGLVYNLGYSQTTEPLTLPNYTPPSPDAFSITKYGDVPVNEFTGMVNSNIPLYTYRAGQLELPISINYVGAGIRVDEVSTWTGINWTLSAGGVITRNVNDIADETSSTRVTLSDTELQDYSDNTFDGTTKGAFIRNLMDNEQIDSEADIFQFSFPGGSGSFYFDENFEPRQVKYDKEIKIELTGFPGETNKERLLNYKEIVITTTDGVKYYFGGTVIEQTSRRYVVNGSVTGQDTSLAVTAYYLTKIEHPINGVILFEYTTDSTTKIIPMQRIEKMKRRILHPFEKSCGSLSYPGESCPGIQPFCFNYIPDEGYAIDYTTISTRVENSRYLQRIYSPYNTEEILFNSQSVDNMHFKRVLNDIEIKKNTGTPFKTIDFEYTPFTQSQSQFGYSDVTKRFFLKKIIFDKDNPIADNTQFGRRNEVYTFEYNNYSQLPERFSYSQDYLGFYNGKSNTSAVPDNLIFNPDNLTLFADRTPNFSNASLGTLTKIFYPTGGYTNFEYEGRKAKVKNFKSINLWAYRNHQELSNPDLLEAGIPEVDENGTVIGLNNVYEDQQIDIVVTLIAGPAAETSITPQNEYAHLTIKDLTTNGTTQSILIAMPSPTGSMNFTGTKQKVIIQPYGITQGHSYEIKIILNPDSANSSPTPMEAYVNIEYYDGYTVIDNLGVRVKKQTNYTADNFPENIKRYYYATIDNLNPTLEDIPLIDTNNYGITQRYVVNMICNANPCCSSGSFEELVYQLESLSSDKIDYSNRLEYGNFENVTISYGGDNFEKGGVEKTFEVSNNIGAIQIETKTNASAYTNSHQELTNPGDLLNTINIPFPKNGNLVKEKYFNSSLKKERETSYVYESNPVHRLNNIIGKREYNDLAYSGTATVGNVVSNYTVGTYLTISAKNEIISEETKEYIDPVPLGVTDESIYNKITTTKDYLYGTLRGSPIKITTNSGDNLQEETNYYYPDQVSQLTGLTQAQIDAVNALVTQFKITSPIQVEKKYLNGNKQQTIRTLYKTFNGNANHVFPEVIQSSKNNLSFEDRVLFNKYDSSGNPSEVKVADGSITKYFYDYKNKVIGKIENYQVNTSLPPGSEFTEITETTPTTGICVNNTNYPNSIVTSYVYESATDLLIQIIDTNCQTTYYEYDALHRLKNIKDNDENIVKEFETNYKRY